MSRLIAPLLVLAMGASPAFSGAWLRAEGDGFLSSTIKVQDDDDTTTYGTLYAEYGINPDLTVGLDIGSDEGGDHKGLAFVLMPLSRDGLHIAFELAAGTLDEGAALRPGISVGRSLSIKDLNGWWSVDTRARLTHRRYLVGDRHHGGSKIAQRNDADRSATAGRSDSSPGFPAPQRIGCMADLGGAPH